MMNSITLPEDRAIFAGYSDFLNVQSAKLLNSEGSSSNRVLHIFCMSAVGKIVRTIVAIIAIQMPRLKPIWHWIMEGVSNDSM